MKHTTQTIVKSNRLTQEQKEANKLARQEARKQAKELAQLEAEKNQKEVAKITISIEWKKSRTWGSNPKCEAVVHFKDGSFDTSPVYTCSGCGYDKESTVIADVFNAYLKYKLHRIGATDKHPYGIYLREDWKTYNGGVGTSCYYRIAEFIGGTFEHTANGKTFDVFTYIDNN